MLLYVKISNFFAVPTHNPELVQAQMRAFSKQMPLLYFILLFNIGFVSMTHFAVAPTWLTLSLPGIFAIFAISRLTIWWRTQFANFTPEQSAKRLKSTILFSGIFGLFLTVWSLMLFPYGGAFEKAHVAFFMAITTMVCVVCLMHLRGAAFLLAIQIILPVSTYLFVQDQAVLTALAGNWIVVMGALLYMVSGHYDDFSTMVSQRVDLENINRETKRLSDENMKLANIDSLTNLPNRRSFFSTVESFVDRSEHTKMGFAIGLIDLDGFKAINDLYGHSVGDQLLIEAARRLSEAIKGKAIAARLGGDEFGLVTSLTDDCAVFGLSICEALRMPYHINELTVEISASCGLAFYGQNCSTAPALIDCADYALYQAKFHSTGNAMIFTESHRQEMQLSHRVDQALRLADIKNEMTLHYQPIYDISTGEIISLEALARWNNATLGQIPPSQFITAAERSPIIEKVTQVLLERLLTDMKRFPENLRVAFNLSSRILASPKAMLQILSTIQKSDIDPRRLEFEVTETALLVDFDMALRALGLLSNLGAHIALDDFGTGYSSLSYVHQLPLDKIKIDRRFVMNAQSDIKAQNIIKTIVGLSNDLNLKCVAEGVETAEQVAFLESVGCHLLQGYFYARPGPTESVLRLIEAENPAALIAAG
ncbi:MAG: EAL domain-containing protein [Alphaproteobacteria bacterium]|nr:EAL domain-containing protein [Alphaproteobacteria bacterium]